MESNPAQPQNSEITHSGSISESSNVSTQSLLQTITATICGDNQEIRMRVLLHLGSERTFVRKQIAESVGLLGPTEILSVTALVGDTRETKRMKRVELSVQARNSDSQKTTLIEVKAPKINEVCNKLRPVNIDISKCPHLKDIKFAESYPRGPTEIDILIGMDFTTVLQMGNVRKD